MRGAGELRGGEGGRGDPDRRGGEGSGLGERYPAGPAGDPRRRAAVGSGGGVRASACPELSAQPDGSCQPAEESSCEELWGSGCVAEEKKGSLGVCSQLGRGVLR